MNKMGKVYDQVCMFKAKYPGTITWWRVRKHARVVEDNLMTDEEPVFSFIGQRNDNMLDWFSTSVCTVTNKRIIVGCDHIITGYTLISITPDMFNDLTVYKGIIWGKVTIDTIKEKVIFTNLDKKSLTDIQNAISENMIKEKKEYAQMLKSQQM